MPTDQEYGALKAKYDALETKCGKLEEEVKELKEECKELEEKCKKLEKELAEESSDFSAFKDKHRAARVQALVDGGKLPPAKAQETISFAAALSKVSDPVNFSAPDGKQEQISAEERYFRELESGPADPRFTANFTAPAPGHYQAGAAAVNPGDVTSKL
jgi:septal ring factor EnvC (AmiA/AmiB activator)